MKIIQKGNLDDESRDNHVWFKSTPHQLYVGLVRAVIS